jgi:hypothetical protein
MSNRIIVTGIDNNPHYMEGLLVFLQSMKINAPKELVYVCLTNVDDAYAGRVLSLGNVKIERICTEEKSSYVRNYIRHSIMLKLMPQYDVVAWIDNDAIVRSSLDSFWDDVCNDSLKIWYRRMYHDLPKKRDKPECFFQGGVYILGSGEHSEMYLNSIIIGLDKKVDWFEPQRLMYLCYKQIPKLKHVDLSEAYNDCKFLDDSIIWHCKQSHFSDKKYQKEYKKYIKQLGL